MEYNGKIPITIVTGCLGSGKTTFIQHTLKNIVKDEDIAIIVNEYGKVGLDHHLIKNVEEKTVLLSGGCICCNSREDLEAELKDLLFSYEKGEVHFDRVLIETTGLADPAPILFTVLNNEMLEKRYVIESVITTVDCVNSELHFKNNPEIMKQVALADKIILTKNDIATEEEIEQTIQRIRNVNPSVKLLLNELIDETIFKENYVKDKAFINVPSIRPKHNDSNKIQSISFTFSKPLDWIAFGLWLSMLLHSNGEQVLRVKGILDVGEEGPIILNGVQHIIHPPQHLKEWPSSEIQSNLIFITRDLDNSLIAKSLEAFQEFLGTKVQMLEYSAL